MTFSLYNSKGQRVTIDQQLLSLYGNPDKALQEDHGNHTFFCSISIQTNVLISTKPAEFYMSLQEQIFTSCPNPK